MIEKFCLFVILLAICLNKANGKAVTKVEYCNSLSCNNTATSILNNMDTSVKPCNDFLQFVCGKNRHSNDPTASKIKPWKKLRHQIQENISSNDDSLVKIVKNFYKSCMQTSEFDKLQLSNEIVDMIEEIGGWPVVKNDKWNSSLFNWNKTIYTYDNEKYWNLNFFDAKLEVDVKNKSQHVIYLSQSSLLKSQEFLTTNFNDKNVNQDYLKFMVDVAVKMGAQYDVAINELKNCLEFGTQLVNLTDVNHESMSLNDLIKEFNFFPWKEYLNSHLPTGVSINNDTIIIISSKSYMKNLEKVLNQTPKKLQANFVVWMMIHEFAEFINEPIDEHQLKSDKCLDIVTKKLVDITRVLYARNYFDKHDREHAKILIKAVKNQLIKMIDNDKWTDEKSKAMAIDKIKININDNFYQEHNLREFENIIEEYNDLKIDQYNFVKNFINLNLFKLKWSKFNKTAFDLSWDSFASGLLYSDTILIGPGSLNNNTLEFTGNILQEPYFNVNHTKYMNYGTLGSKVASSIIENLKINWTSSKMHQQIVQCRLNKKQQFFIDTIGIKAAYSTYQNVMKNNKAEQKLFGLTSYTSNQMFWINLLSSKCNKQQDITEHQVFENTKEFIDDFKCSIGSNVHPADRCIF